MERIPGTTLYSVTVGSIKVDGLSYDDAVTMIKLLYGNKEKQEKEDNNG